MPRSLCGCGFSVSFIKSPLENDKGKKVREGESRTRRNVKGGEREGREREREKKRVKVEGKSK